MTESRKTLTFALMDAPFRSARSTTALRLIDAATRRGYAVNVFAYEGAVLLPLRPAGKARQCRARPRRRRRKTIRCRANGSAALIAEADRQRRQARLGQLRTVRRRTWCCGGDPGVRRGSPADFWKMATASDGTRSSLRRAREGDARAQYRRNRLSRHARGAGRHGALDHPGDARRRGGDRCPLLQGNAVNYAVRAQHVAPLGFGGHLQKPGARSRRRGGGADRGECRGLCRRRGYRATAVLHRMSWSAA